MILTATIKVDNESTVGVIVAQPKDFASGSTGFHGTAKITIGEDRYQVQVQAVKIGSKNEPADDNDK